MTRDVCRFAPSTTGPAHLGTLAAALLCWLDARSRGARLILRLEDLDPDRCRPEHADSIRAEREEQLRLADRHDPDVRTDEHGNRLDDGADLRHDPEATDRRA